MCRDPNLERGGLRRTEKQSTMPANIAHQGETMSGGPFFSLDQRADHWWFLTPDGSPFFSIGMNHFDSATLRYPESGDVWRTKLPSAAFC